MNKKLFSQKEIFNNKSIVGRNTYNIEIFKIFNKT